MGQTDQKMDGYPHGLLCEPRWSSKKTIWYFGKSMVVFWKDHSDILKISPWSSEKSILIFLKDRLDLLKRQKQKEKQKIETTDKTTDKTKRRNKSAQALLILLPACPGKRFFYFWFESPRALPFGYRCLKSVSLATRNNCRKAEILLPKLCWHVQHRGLW